MADQSNEMVERVARALCAAGHHAWPETDGYNDRAEKRAFYDMARAAIEAMLEPTKSMIDDMHDEIQSTAHISIQRATIEAAWKIGVLTASIDAALQEKQG